MAYRSSSKHVPNSSGTSTVIPVPAGVQAGDIVVVRVYKESTAAVTAPSGFVEEFSDTTNASTAGAQHIYWKRLTAADTGSYTFSWSGSAWRSGYAIAYSGRISSGDPFTSTANQSGNTASLSLTGLSAAAGDDGFAGGHDWNGATTYSCTGGGTWTNRQTGDDVAVFSQDNLSAGALGTVTYSDNGGGQKKAFVGLLAAEPVGGGGISADLTTVTETDNTVSLTGAKARDLAVTAEADSAVALQALKDKSVAVVAETDTVVALVYTKARSLNTIVETDSIVSLTSSKTKDLTPVTETDSIVTLVRQGNLGGSLNTITETDTVVGLVGTKTRSLAPTIEADAPVGLQKTKARALSFVSEAGAVVALTGAKAKALGAVLETDTVVALVGGGGGALIDHVRSVTIRLTPPTGSIKLTPSTGSVQLESPPAGSVQLTPITGSAVLDD